jgi:hypothetical protein
MKYIRRFLSFWYNFIVGDDWRIAVGVVVGLGLAASFAHSGDAQMWWLLPVLVIAMLTLSLWLATRHR